MGVMDKFLTYMKLNEDDDYGADEGDYDDELDAEPEEPKRGSGVRSSRREDDSEYGEKQTKRTAAGSQPKVTPINNRTGSRKVSGNGMQVCAIKPTSFNDAQEITETLLSGQTVVMNLEGLDIDVAQRIMDFTYGSCFAISGNFQKISHYIFILTPKSVDLSGDFQEILGSSFEPPYNN